MVNPESAAPPGSTSVKSTSLPPERVQPGGTVSAIPSGDDDSRIPSPRKAGDSPWSGEGLVTLLVISPAAALSTKPITPTARKKPSRCGGMLSSSPSPRTRRYTP